MKADLQEVIEKWENSSTVEILKKVEIHKEEDNYALLIKSSATLSINGELKKIDSSVTFTTIAQGKNTDYPSLTGDMSNGDVVGFQEYCLKVERDMLKKISLTFKVLNRE
ncbi:hypothetical protein VB776_18305 [Arcicella sp. DC2W]|uniref:SCP2 domain-containing protein n=1 Tax=Arcicella gelida TaxID=2984195 RepID=A0ABU5S8U0_9BACT|nr:hypothetical protein [Arcicella sp. DC2W]MEA5404894.1 hypothetical protein [Arcicella sp. DC2W]